MERIKPLSNFLNYGIKDSEQRQFVISLTSVEQICRKPWYLRTDIFKRPAIEWLVHLATVGQGKIVNDIMVVSKSLRYPPMHLLENEFIKQHRNCLVTENTNAIKDDKRIIFTTVQAAHSLSRTTVVVMSAGMDSKDLFKACAASNRKLLIVDDARDINDDDTTNIPIILNPNYIYDINTRANGAYRNQCRTKPVPEEMDVIPPYQILQDPKESITMVYGTKPNPLESKTFVGDINGLAIPMIFEQRLTGKITLVEELRRANILRACKVFIDTADFSKVSNILKLANIYLYSQNGYVSRIYEIANKDYNWLGEDIVNALMERMGQVIGKDAKFEVNIGGYKMDVIDGDVIWEIKCKKRLEIKDLQQLEKYAQVDKWERTYRLFNVVTNEIRELLKP